ncbi:MAG: lysophospholipid acyltransferase family protein [Candidatus Nanopelagicales bacterium]
MFYWLLKYIFLGPILRLLYRPQLSGLENVPNEGPVILAINHNSFMDSLFLPLMVKRPVTYLAKDEYFLTPGFKGFWMKFFFTNVGQVPIDRSGGDASEAALNTGVRVLSGGNMLGIYPEGTRSPDGKLYRGHTGVARMALAADAVVVPVALHNTREVQPAGTKVPRIKKIGINIGKPLNFSRYEGMDNDRFVLRSMTDEIMYEIMQLSDQDYSDMYASKAKKLIAETGSSDPVTVKPVTGEGSTATDSEAPVNV